MADLFHECGVAAVYHLSTGGISPMAIRQSPEESSRYIPSLLQEIQNRGQLAAGMTSWSPTRKNLLATHKEVGSVAEAFHLPRPAQSERLMAEMSGPAAIGHVRYATCGQDDRNYAHPFERQHIEKTKWFSFVFNGQLANYPELKREILAQQDFYLSRETDTEVIMHLLCQELAGERRPSMIDLVRNISGRMDGAYVLAYLNALGHMFVARDPLGIRPLCYVNDGSLFVAASESVALANIGFRESDIKDLEPGHAIIIENGQFSIESFVSPPSSTAVQPVNPERISLRSKPTSSLHVLQQDRAHCFFEWIYFANVASTLDSSSVYLARKRLGEELARVEDVVRDDDTIVVPVPDTAKAAADAMAYALGVPCLEGLIRNRYVGRTFIDHGDRAEKARRKYTPLREVMGGKRVLLVEDTIVRSTTMKALIRQIRERGGAKEVHIRVACPPIIAPCFYGIDMSTVAELFAPKHLNGEPLSSEIERRMAVALEADSLRYLPLDAIARAVGKPANQLCQGCLTGQYPTPCGAALYEKALQVVDGQSSRTYDDNDVLTGARL